MADSKLIHVKIKRPFYKSQTLAKLLPAYESSTAFCLNSSAYLFILPVMTTETDNSCTVIKYIINLFQPWIIYLKSLLSLESNTASPLRFSGLSTISSSQALRAWVIPIEDRSTEHIVKALSGSASIVIKKENVLVSDSKIDVALPSGYLELLQQKRYSPNTIKTYTSYFLHFQRHFSTKNIEKVTKEEINAYLLELINRKNISESQQNQRINAIKKFHG